MDLFPFYGIKVDWRKMMGVFPPFLGDHSGQRSPFRLD